MPDATMTGGSNNTNATPAQTPQSSIQDEPAIATMSPMEMSAPIEQLPSDVIVEAPAETSQHKLLLPDKPAPLSDVVAPFATQEPVAPAVDYVVAPEAIPQVQPEAPIQKARPVQPVAPQTPPPMAVNPPAPSTPASLPPASSVQAANPRVNPQPIQQRPAMTVQAATYAQQPAIAPSVVAQTEAFSGKSPTIYSNNSRAVRRARRTTKTLYILAVAGLFVIGGALFAFWLSIGSPTSIESVPYFQDMAS